MEYLVSAAAILESAREVTKDVAKAIVGEKYLRSELRPLPRSHDLLGLLRRSLYTQGFGRIIRSSTIIPERSSSISGGIGDWIGS